MIIALTFSLSSSRNQSARSMSWVGTTPEALLHPFIQSEIDPHQLQ